MEMLCLPLIVRGCRLWREKAPPPPPSPLLPSSSPCAPRQSAIVNSFALFGDAQCAACPPACNLLARVRRTDRPMRTHTPTHMRRCPSSFSLFWSPAHGASVLSACETERRTGPPRAVWCVRVLQGHKKPGRVVV